MQSKLSIIPATPQEIPILLGLIKELAEYERLLPEVTATEEILYESFFGKNPKAHALLARFEGEIAGFAVYCYHFSTFVGLPGLYLEDVYVKPEYRARKIGISLLKVLAKKALEENCGRFEWSVLDWNQPAIDFYKNLGAKPMDEWTVFRLSKPEIEALAKS